MAAMRSTHELQEMTSKTIGILGPGDMGHAVGRALRDRSYQPLTCLAGRSSRTRKLAAAARREEMSGPMRMHWKEEIARLAS